MKPLFLAATITPGVHPEVHLGPFTFDIDVIASTVVAGLVVIGLGLLLRRQATSGVPGKLQLFWETIVGQVQDEIGSAIGPQGAFVAPIVVTLFIFILTANWLGLIPTGHHPELLPPPASDVNFTYALALFVFIGVQGTWIRRAGLGRYLGHFARPFKLLIPLNIVETLAQPISLSLRLFGNIFAGTILVALIATLFPFFLLWLPQVIWKLFDLFIGAIQAFIFSLLTILYFTFALSEDGGH